MGGVSFMWDSPVQNSFLLPLGILFNSRSNPPFAPKINERPLLERSGPSKTALYGRLRVFPIRIPNIFRQCHRHQRKPTNTGATQRRIGKELFCLRFSIFEIGFTFDI